MIRGANSGSEVSPFYILATDGGAHSAYQWASITANMIVQHGEGASLEARADIANLQMRIQEELFGVFQEAKASTSAEEVIVITSQAARRISEIAAPTRWAHIFSSAPVQSEIEILIKRNLMSANEIALRVE